jgi:hypothetical protein
MKVLTIHIYTLALLLFLIAGIQRAGKWGSRQYLKLQARLRKNVSFYPNLKWEPTVVRVGILTRGEPGKWCD